MYVALSYLMTVKERVSDSERSNMALLRLNVLTDR